MPLQAEGFEELVFAGYFTENQKNIDYLHNVSLIVNCYIFFFFSGKRLLGTQATTSTFIKQFLQK